MPNLVFLVQARIESTRFPGKVLAPLLGQPMLLHVLDRLGTIWGPQHLLVATPATSANQAILHLCQRHGVPAVAVGGDPEDVLARYAAAVERTEADVIVRITADCPLVCPDVVDALIRCRDHADADYAYLAPEYGDGWDCGVFTRAALRRADGEATRRSEREHVEPYFRRPEAGFTTVCLPCPLDVSWFRGSVDTPDDLRRVERLLVAALDCGLGARPDWRALALLCERYPRHKDGMLRKPLNQAYHDQVAAEEEDESYA